MADFARFFQYSLDLLATFDPEGHLVDLNPMWTRVMGYSPEELQGRSFTEFIHPEDLGPTLALMNGEGKISGVASFENRYRRKNGEYRWLSWNASPPGPDGLLYLLTDEDPGRLVRVLP